ncbi:MAG TPA: DUF4097 family beta strand repeat-containing protein [Terriglobales bacterium]
MASTTQIPPAPQPPQYQPRHPRSITGPIVLIAIGVLFLLEKMGVLHWRNLGYWFAHYWPLLLILFGVVKLIEHMAAQRSGTPSPGLGVGGAIIIVAIIFWGLVATHAARVDWNSLGDQLHIDDNDFPFFGHSYSFEDQLAQTFPAGGNLHITNDRGAVNITAADDNQIRISVHKRVNAENQEEADKWNGQTRPQITVSGQNVTVNANTQGAGDHGVASDLDISIPRKATVVVDARHGDGTILGRDGDVSLSAQHGDVSITDINGNVHLDLQDSSAHVSKISGDVNVGGKADDVSFEDIKGTLTLDGDFTESVRLARIAKTFTFKSARTEINFAKLDGDLDLDSGDLRINNVMGPVRVSTKAKDIGLIGVSGDLRLKNENGSVEVQMTKMGSMDIATQNADIQLGLPVKAGFQLDARSHGGEIDSDFDGLGIHNGDEQSTAAGSVGGGGPHIVINNEHGSIQIHKGAIEADDEEPPAPKPPKGPHSNSNAPAVTDN